MRVLWLINLPLPSAAEHIGIKPTSTGGWLETLSQSLGESSEIDLSVAFPQSMQKKTFIFVCDKIHYFGFYEAAKPDIRLQQKLVDCMEYILKESQPDIVHIWGSEYIHSYAMADAFGKPEKTLLSVQGLISVISKHYTDGLPEYVVKGWTFRDFLRHDNIAIQQRNFALRGEYEIKLIRTLKHIIGRTKWDYACSLDINPSIAYHKCNEILRRTFYHAEKWTIDHCTRHTIFMMQMSYPVKGFHYLLEALPIVIRKYPDTMVYIAGENIIRADTIKAGLKMGSYALYLNRLIKEQGLCDRIIFLGNMNATQIVKQMQSANVFVLPSIIENSSNSLGEAMLLGVPCIASEVGGNRSVIEDKKEGLLYRYDDSIMLADAIIRLFMDDQMCTKLSNAARKRALEDHEESMCIKTYLNVYQEIYSSNMRKRD